MQGNFELRANFKSISEFIRHGSTSFSQPDQGLAKAIEASSNKGKGEAAKCRKKKLEREEEVDT